MNAEVKDAIPVFAPKAGLQWGRVRMNAEVKGPASRAVYLLSLQWGRVRMNAEVPTFASEGLQRNNGLLCASWAKLAVVASAKRRAIQS